MAAVLRVFKCYLLSERHKGVEDEFCQAEYFKPSLRLELRARWLARSKWGNDERDGRHVGKFETDRQFVRRQESDTICGQLYAYAL